MKKQYGTVPMVVCLRVPVILTKEPAKQSKDCDGNPVFFNVAKIMKSKLKGIRISKQELMDVFKQQDMMEMTDHFEEEELNTYFQGL